MDGQTKNVTLEDLIPGTLLREVHDTSPDQTEKVTPPFGDSMIVEVGYSQPNSSHGIKVVKLVRPYVQATGQGTVCPNWVAGFEQYEVSVDYLLSWNCHLKVVVMSTGKPASFLG